MLAIAAVPANALAGDPQPSLGGEAQEPFGGTIDVQRGAINGQVTLDSLAVSLSGSLSDPGVEGELQVTIPRQFAGSASAANGALSYSLAVCGAGVAFGLRGSSGSELHVAFHDADADPNACSAAAPMAISPPVMGPHLAAIQTQPAVSASDSQALLLNWLRRLFAFSLIAVLLVLIIPSMPNALAVATQRSPWGRIGIGVALALTLPLLGVLLFAVGLPIGLWWLGGLVLMLYPVLLVLSLVVSGLALGSWTSRHVKWRGIPVWVPFGIALLVLSFVSLLPYVGPAVNVSAVIFGLGTLVLAPRSERPVAQATSNGLEPATSEPSSPADSSTAVAA
jgi:hypothetical protein